MKRKKYYEVAGLYLFIESVSNCRVPILLPGVDRRPILVV